MDINWKRKIELFKKNHKHLPIPDKSGFRMAVYAPSFSGKSFMINDLLTNPEYGYNKVFKPSQIFIMSPTYKNDDSYKDLKKMMKDNPENIIDNYNEDFINSILDFQHQKLKENKCRPVLLIIDDLITSIKSTRQGKLVDLFIKGRHHKVNIIITSQKYKLVPSSIRVNSSANIYFTNNMNKKELDDIAYESSDDYFKPLAENLRKDYFQYDFIYCNMKKPYNEKYYKNFNKKFNIKLEE